MQRHTPLSIPESDPRACSAGVRGNALVRVPFFRGLDHAAVHEIDGLAAMHALEEGEAVHLTGQPADRLYVVATGAVRLSATSASGDELLLDVLGPGNWFGTLPALGGQVYAEDAWGLTAGCLLSFTADRFDTVMERHPTVARQALATVGRRLQTTQERIRRTASAAVPARVAAVLLALAERLGRVEDDRIVVDVPLARDDLASLAGCAPETVSRHLARWRRQGIVDTGRRWVAVRQPAALAEIAGIDTPLATAGSNGNGPALG